MAELLSATVRVTDFNTLTELLAELDGRNRLHLSGAMVDDQGMVEPVRQGNTLVMQPRVRVVVTVFDHKANEILRWQDKWDVGTGTVTIHAPSGQGNHRDPTGVRTREQAIASLKLRNFQVSKGEWTPQSIVNILADTAKL